MLRNPATLTYEIMGAAKSLLYALQYVGDFGINMADLFWIVGVQTHAKL